MNYTQNKAVNSKIRENEWATANRLGFSTFTSCIGIVGYQKNRNGSLFGVHMVQVQSDFFNNIDAQKVVDLVKANCEKGTVKIFGCIDCWEPLDSYSYLKTLLGQAGYTVEVVARPTSDGIYTATFNTVTAKIDIVKS